MEMNQTEVAVTGKDRHYLGHPFEYWARKFREDDCDDRHLPGRALASFGEKSIPCFLEALQFEDYQFPALMALKSMGRPAFSAVNTLLKSANPFLRKQGVQLVKELCHDGPGFTHWVLCDVLEDEDPEVRCEAARAIRWLAISLSPRLILALAKAAKDSNVRVRFHAVQALIRIDSDDEEGTDCLLEALQDMDIAVRLAAAESLDSVKPNSKKAARSSQ